MGNNHAVELRGISKTYPGSANSANRNISLNLRRGEILCIAGENGAGKTTLMKIMSGLEIPDEGEICIYGASGNCSAVAIDSPLAAQRLGIGMVHQHFMLFPEYTVAENIVMGLEPCKWGFLFDRKKAQAEAAKVIEAHHFSIDPGQPVRSLSIGEMQQVEICRLLYRNAGIVILDEPTSVLTEHETSALYKALRALAAEKKSIFLITHKLHEIKSIADRVAVLRRGEVVGVCSAAETDEYAIAKMMMGLSPEYITQTARPRESHCSSKPVIVFDNVTVRRRGQKRPLLDKISFSVRPGEIAAFTGVGGNGLGVLEAVLGGFLHPAEGKIIHKGKDISRLNIRRLRNMGLAYIPADRQRIGSASAASIEENLIIDRRMEFSRMGLLNRRAISNFANAVFSRYGIASPGGRKPAAALSGGNLQKLILAREIDQFRDYFVFCEPTWGLDIAAGNFVWNEIAALRDKGAAIIVITTNLDEALALAGRIFVMYKGSAIAEFGTEFGSTDESASCIKEKINACMQGLVPAGMVKR